MNINYEKILSILLEHAKGFRILCVDDDALFLETLQETLARFHFEVVSATSVAEALDLYNAQSFDIIISDLSMPQRDGVELIKEIKEKNSSQAIAVISAFGDLETLHELINLGVTKFISKPLEPLLFMRALYELCELVYNAKQAENKMANLLKQYKNAIDKSSIVTMSDLRGKITYANDNFCKISGYTQEELIGKPHSILRSPRVDKKVFEDLWKTIQAKEMWQGTVENKSKNGQYYTVYATILPILDQMGEIIKYISIRQDITELKKLQTTELSEKVAKASSIHLENDIEMFPLPTIILDEGSKILHMNQLFKDATYGFFAIQDSFEDAFVEKTGYIRVDAIFDWKHDVLEFHETNKVILRLGEREKEFSIHIQSLAGSSAYILSLCELIHYE